MNDWLVAWGIESWKPAFRLLLLPPVPMLLLGLLGWALVPRWPRFARLLGVASLVALWLVCTPWAAHRLQLALLPSMPPLSVAAVAGLANQPGAPRTAILVLGAGRRTLAPDYGGAVLKPLGHERLRYGAWLARQTGLPLAYSGGVGHGAAQQDGPTEAEAAAQVLAREGGPPLRWSESRSRDTNENAIQSVALLQAQGIRRIVLVTHDFHQPRALAAFRRAIARSGQPMDLLPAPMGQHLAPTGQLTDYVPTSEGLQRSTLVLYEWLGRLAGA